MATLTSLILPLTDGEVQHLRTETPGVDNAAYLMSAGAALVPARVDAAIRRHLDLELSIGGYAAADARQVELDGVYDSVARLVGASREDIALTENATVAWQMAFSSLNFKPGDRILTGEAEYGANYVSYLQAERRWGVTVEVVPSDEHGQLDIAALEDTIDERVRLISLTWIPTNGGLVNPAAEVGRVARQHSIFYLLDACQAVGQLPVDVTQLGCDAMSATGRKFLRGPRGTGFLYVRPEALAGLEPPMIDHFSAPWTALGEYSLRGDARRFETWENSYALRAGLGAAAEYALEVGIDRIHDRCNTLADRLRAGLAGIDGARMLDLGVEQCAIVSFDIPSVPAGLLVDAARRQNIVIGTSGPNSTLIDASRRGLGTINRASPHYFNTEAEVDLLLDFLAGQAA